MAKARLEFNLDDIEDRAEHFRCIKSLDMALCLSQIEMTLNKRIESRLENTKLDLSPFETKEMIMEMIYDIYSEYDIKIENLIN